MDKIVIVGAGLVGSLLAVLLKQKGYDVTIYERRDDPRKRKAHVGEGRSINLVITSRGLFALKQAGLLENAMKLSSPVYGRMIHPLRGEPVFQPYGREDEKNNSISRGDLNAFLITEAQRAGVHVHFGHTLEELNADAKRAIFVHGDRNIDVDYTILFGADGAGSRVRGQLQNQYPDLFQGAIEWLEADYKELFIPTGSGLKTDGLHIWPRGSHMLMGLPNLDGSFTMTLYLPKKGGANSFEATKDAEGISSLFNREFASAFPMIPDYVTQFKQNPQGALGTLRLNNWIYKDSIALIGDAAHAIVPFFGQGMNSGFEDCTTLLGLISAHAMSAHAISTRAVNGQSWQHILTEYNTQRIPNAHAIADMALENWVEMRDKVADPQFQLRKKVDAYLEKEFPHQYKSRYGLITYTLVPYAVAQEAGRVQETMFNDLKLASIEDLSRPRAEAILKKHFVPFLERNQIQI